jgi:methionine synthase II (cobalamin-independent)
MGKVLLRADHVGSLLRSDEVKNARKSYYEEHTIDKSELTEIENQSIKALITNRNI